jgi:hypothetical protein
MARRAIPESNAIPVHTAAANARLTRLVVTDSRIGQKAIPGRRSRTVSPEYHSLTIVDSFETIIEHCRSSGKPVAVTA